MSIRAEQKEATRAKLVAAAREQFTAFGYEGVGIRDLAKAIGMSTGAVFGQFGSKDALWEAVMGRPAPNVLGFLVAFEGEPTLDTVMVQHQERAARLRQDLYGADVAPGA